MPAQKLLSTVVRLERERGQRYGAGHLVDILLGRATARVTQLGHSGLSVFGIGTELSEAEWRGVVRQLLAQGLLAVDADGYGTLRLSPTSAEVLCRGPGGPAAPGDGAGADPCPAGRPARRRRRPTSTRPPPASSTGCAPGGRRPRRSRACPAYVVFHDATLREIATRRPASLDELGGVTGVGATKLERYGPGLLEALGA